MNNARNSWRSRRKDSDPKYKPIYEALLTRGGLERKYRQEAVDALTKLDHSDPVSVILDAVGKIEAADKGTSARAGIDADVAAHNRSCGTTRENPIAGDRFAK